MKVLINSGVGCFGLSFEAMEILYKNQIKGIYKQNDDIYWIDHLEFKRNDQKAIELIEQIGLQRACGDFCKLEIVSIPDDVKRWEIVTDDSGNENIVYGDYYWYGE